MRKGTDAEQGKTLGICRDPVRTKKGGAAALKCGILYREMKCILGKLCYEVHKIAFPSLFLSFPFLHQENCAQKHMPQR